MPSNPSQNETPKPWALITGASSGIGRALSQKFSQKGFNLVLIARDSERLQEIARECENLFGSKVVLLSKDLSKSSSSQEIFKYLENQKIFIEVLVNNAGFGLHGAYVDTDLSKELEMINVHIGSFLQLTKLFLVEMIKRRKGRILNVASVYSYSPVPHQSVYAATKAFMLSFSESLRNELRGSGVSVTILCPGITKTEFRSRMGVGERRAAGGMKSEKVADVAYKALMRKRFLAIPGFFNQIYVFLARMIPQSVMTPLVRFLNNIRGLKQHHV